MPEELERLAALHRAGDLDDNEYAAAKRQVLRPTVSAGPAPSLEAAGYPAEMPAPMPLNDGWAQGESGATKRSALARWVAFGLDGYAVGSLLLFMFAMDAIAKYRDWLATPGSRSVEAAMYAADDRMIGLLDLLAVCRLVLAALFIMWLWKARTQAAHLPGAELRWARGWTVGAWLIPVAFVVLPYYVVSDVARAAGRPSRRVLTSWWLLFTVALMSLYGTGRLWAAGLWSEAYAAVLVGAGAGALAAVLAARIVSDLSDAVAGYHAV